MQLFHQKLAIPHVPSRSLPRPAVTQTLDAAAAANEAVLVIGAAGWGKTTVLATWAQRRQPAVCWYSLDDNDRDPMVFLRYLLTMLSPHYPCLVPLLNRLQGSASFLPFSALGEEIVRLITDNPRPLTVILDDLQELSEGDSERVQWLFDLIGRLIRYTPLQLVLASRTSIPSMSRLLIEQRVRIVDLSRVDFTAEDIAALARTRYGLEIDSQAAALLEISQGWPTAITLALEGWPDQMLQIRAQLTDSLPNQVLNQLYHFLAEQVFMPLSPALQQFLLDTALLDNLTVERCDLLREADDSAALLAQVVEHNLFVTVQHQSARYHELFRAFLLKLLWQTPDRARRLTRRVAELYQRWDEPQAALDRLLELGDLAAAAELVQRVGPTLRKRAQQATVLSWIDTLAQRGPLPPALLLLQAHAAADIADWNTAYVALQKARVSEQSEIVVEARLIEILIATLRKEEAIASELLSTIQLETLPPPLCSLGYMIFSRVALLQGHPDQAVGLLKQAIAAHDGSASQDPDQLPTLYDLLGLALAAAGDQVAAIYYLRQANAAWEVLGYQARRITTLNNLAMVAIAEGRLGEAWAWLEEGMELAERYGQRRDRVLLLCSLGDIALIEVRLELALAYFTQASETATRIQMPAERAYACAGALRSSVLQNNRAECARWQQALEQVTTTANPTFYRSSIALAQAFVAPPQVGLSYLEQAAAAPKVSPCEHAMSLLLQAQFLYELGGWERAATSWQRLEEARIVPHFDALLYFQLQRTPGLLADAGKGGLAQRLRSQKFESTAQWEFRTLGTFSIVSNGQEYGQGVRPIDQIVIIRLLESGQAGLPVLSLWQDVWNDQPFSSDALRQALSRIRRATTLPIRLHRGHCQLQISAQDIFYDVASFEVPLPSAPSAPTSEARATLAQTIELYRGPFLSHLHHESPWLEQRRAALHRRMLYLRELQAQMIENDDPEQALAIYSEVLDYDSCREIATAGAMRCAIAVGDRPLAISFYQRACTELLDKLGSDPSPFLVQLYHQIA